MGNDSFLNNEWVVLEEAGYQSSYALVLTEMYLENRRSAEEFPTVKGYKYEWGVIKEYRIDNMIMWNFHFFRLQEEMELIGVTGEDIVMVCLAHLDLDFWPDGTSFWGMKTRWPDGNSILERGGDRPKIQNCRHQVPMCVGLSLGGETKSLSIGCLTRDESRARHWVGKVFLPLILDEMLQHVEEALIRYEKK